MTYFMMEKILRVMLGQERYRHNVKSNLESSIAKIGIGYLIGMTMTFLGIMEYRGTLDANRNYGIPFEDCPLVTQEYDFNGDGLNDIARKDGKILIQSSLGEYTSLVDFAKDVSDAILDNYSAVKGMDGGYFTKCKLENIEDVVEGGED